MEHGAPHRRPGVGACPGDEGRIVMLRRTRPWRCCAAVALTATVLAGARATRADLIFLKDGTVLQGQVKRESRVEFDPVTHEAFHMAQGFFLVDDGPRRMYFCQNQVGRIVPQKEG